ncbi:hypothetical protein HMPREF0693_2635 [Proteus mirabilis ATCC 29906]|nr:hypothetical protein HMPREF0693_2635 [Proteus mirabilis ATCC 29906]
MWHDKLLSIFCSKEICGLASVVHQLKKQRLQTTTTEHWHNAENK